MKNIIFLNVTQSKIIIKYVYINLQDTGKYLKNICIITSQILKSLFFKMLIH